MRAFGFLFSAFISAPLSLGGIIEAWVLLASVMNIEGSMSWVLELLSRNIIDLSMLPNAGSCKLSTVESG
jgi:hypothetical protein